MRESEFTEDKKALDGKGLSINNGWARKEFFMFKDSEVWTPQGFCTASDKYVIFSNASIFLFELCNNASFGFLHVSVVSLLDKHRISKTVRMVLPIGRFHLPSSSQTESVKFDYKGNLFECIVTEDGMRILKADVPHMGRGRRLRGCVVLEKPPDAQSLFTNSSWPLEPKRFKLTRCSPWWNVEGVMQFENMELAFNKDKAWGIYYWNRLARPKNDLHFWASGCGRQDGVQISFNIGCGSEDSSHGTENAFFINGKLYKLDYVTFHYAFNVPMKSWNFTGSDNRLDMIFTPMQEEVRNNYFLMQADLSNIYFGFFSGRLFWEDGSLLRFSHITGVIERRRTRN